MKISLFYILNFNFKKKQEIIKVHILKIDQRKTYSNLRIIQYIPSIKIFKDDFTKDSYDKTLKKFCWLG